MKYYQIKPNVIFRNYGDFGYITDNRNYGYHFTNTIYVLGDRIVSESGAVILSCLEKKPLSMDEIVSRAMKEFVDANEIQLRSDAESLLQTLTEGGFIITGESAEECRGNSYCAIKHKINNKSLEGSTLQKPSNTTQAFFEKRFGDTPFPISVHIEIVSKCNERCVHCYIPHEYKNQVMDTELFFDLMNQCRDLKIQHITISGLCPTPSYYVQQLFSTHAGDYYYGDVIQVEGDVPTLGRSCVFDSQSGDVILKLANADSVTVQVRADLSRFKHMGKTAQVITLTGTPDAQNTFDDARIRPQESTMKVTRSLSIELPPHTLQVIRITRKAASH